MNATTKGPRPTLLSPLGRGRAEVVIRCPRRLEPLLKNEIAALELPEARLFFGGGRALWSLSEAERFCFHSRIASRLLWPLVRFPALSSEGLYAGVRQLPWHEWLNAPQSLGIGFDGVSAQLRHTRFSALRVKDGIFDRLRDEGRSLPELDQRPPALQLHGVLHREQAHLFVALGGGALHRRGWRRAAGVAPVKENLAAAVLRLGGWGYEPEGPLFDPMCGAGTFLVEGGLMALGIPPGFSKARSGHDAWAGADPGQWEGLREAVVPSPKPIILVGRDADPEQLDRTQAHFEAAGLAELDQVTLDLAPGRLEAHEGLTMPPALIVTNPPYGARLAAGADLLDTVGRALKKTHPGTPLALLVGVPADEEADGRALQKKLGIEHVQMTPLLNGALEAFALIGKTPAAAATSAGAELPSAEALAFAGADLSDPAFAAALKHGEAFANRLRKNLAHLGRWARRQRLTAYRLYDRDLPEYVLTVDHYGDALCVQSYQAPDSIDPVLAERRLKAALTLLPEATGIGEARIYLRERRPTTPADQYTTLDHARDRRQVQEGNARFWVNLSDYLDTGLYLDSRGVRRAVGELLRLVQLRAQRQGGAGARFLNLFCYTGTATVQAALAGADRTLSVDLSRTYLAWAQENFALNGLDGRRHGLVQADVREWLTTPPERPEETGFDVILLDPPTFSNSARMDGDLDLQRDHGALISQALARLAPGGVLFFVTHARRFQMTFEAPQWRCTEKTKQTLDEDCARGRPAHRSWLFEPTDP